MNTLAFANLAVIVHSVLKPIEEREKELKAIPEQDPQHRLIFTAFLGYEGALFDNYPNSLKYPVGYLYRGNIITSEKAIVEISRAFYADNGANTLKFRAHLNYYYTSLDIYPPWHTDLYDTTVKEGATPRKLQGPHAPSGLSTGESRWVVYDKYKELIYGPRA